MTKNNGTKKMLTGAAAIAAGAALLLGGGGTLAAWNASADAAAGTIATGDLSLSPVEGSKPTWFANGTSVTDIGQYRMVPGDQLTLSQELKLDLAGTNLTAELSASFGEPLKEPFLGHVSLGNVTVEGAGNRPLQVDNLRANDSGQVTASVTVIFDENAPMETAGKSLSLSDLKFNLFQK